MQMCKAICPNLQKWLDTKCAKFHHLLRDTGICHGNHCRSQPGREVDYRRRKDVDFMANFVPLHGESHLATVRNAAEGSCILRPRIDMVSSLESSVQYGTGTFTCGPTDDGWKGCNAYIPAIISSKLRFFLKPTHCLDS